MKKSEPNVASPNVSSSGGHHTPRQQRNAQHHLSSTPVNTSGGGVGGRSSIDVINRSNNHRDVSPNSRLLLTSNTETSGASSTPGSPKPGRQQWLGAKQRDSSPASSGGAGGGGSTKAANMMIVSSGGSWYDDMPGGSGGEGVDEMDGGGSGGAHDSRSSGGGSADWTQSFADGTPSLDVEKMRMMSKIEHIKEKLIAANRTKEADVDEFLRLTSNVPIPGDNPQMIRIRQVFEKKNKKSAHTIMTLQKKLDAYQQKLRDLELGNTSGGGGSGAKKPRSDNVLTNVGQGLNGVFENIKEGLSGLSSASQTAAGTVISVPKDLAHKLLKKSDSADNIHSSNSNSQNPQTPPIVASTATTMLVTTSSGGSGRGDSTGTSNNRYDAETSQQSNYLDGGHSKAGGSTSRSVHGAPTAVFYTDLESRERASSDAISPPDAPTTNRTLRSVSPPSFHPSASARTLMHQQQDTPMRRGATGPYLVNAAQYEQQQHQFEQLLQEMQGLKRSNDQMAENLNELRSKIQHEYAYFHAAVHELTFRVQRVEDQLNDQGELHSAEVNGLRGDLQTVEARVSYQMTQIDGDLKDVIGRVTTRVEAMEHRVKDQFGVDQNAVGTLAIRAGYLLAQTFLTIVFLITQGLLPFMKTRARSVTTVVVLVAAIIFYRNFDVFQEWTLRISRRG